MNKHIHCPHFNFCSGCAIDENVDSPAVSKEVELFFKSKGWDVQIFAGKAVGWRYRAKLAIRGTYEKPKIGLFREGSHEVVDIPFCKVHHPKINQAVHYLRQFIQEEQIQPYNEITFKGDLRYAQIIVERSSGKVQISLVWNALCCHRDFSKLWQMNPSFWHSIWMNCNVRKDNIIFGDKWSLMIGNDELWETFNGVEVCFHPASFAQANLDLFEVMLKKIVNQIEDQAKIVEYYAGVGVIGLTIVHKSAWVKCLEINPEAQKCFEKSHAKLPPKMSNRISFQVGSAEILNSFMDEANIVIVDPPRKGIHKPLLQAILNNSTVHKIIYVSCGWPAFQKDCEILLSKGWEITLAEAYLFFPGSNHLEVLCVFTRSNKNI